MNKPVGIMLKLALIVLFSLGIQSMKQSEAGSNDWHLKNIGSLTHIYPIKNNRLFFMSELGQFGHLSKETGNIQTRLGLSPDQKMININSKQVTVVTPYNQVLTYRVQTLDKIVENRLVNDINTLGPIVGYIRRDDGLVYVAGSKQLRIYAHGTMEHNVLIQAQSIQNFLHVLEIQDEGQKKIILVSQTPHSICTQEVVGKNIIDKSSLSSCHEFISYSPIRRIFTVQKHLCVSSTIWTSCFNLQNKTDPHVFDTEVLGTHQSHILHPKGSYSLLTRKHQSHRVVDDGQGSEIRVEQSEEDDINLFRNDYKMSTLLPQANGKIRNVWVNFKNEIDYDVLIQFKDLKLSFYHFARGVPAEVWSREESLAYIDRVLFMKVQTENRLDNDYHRKMLSTEYKNKPLVNQLMEVPVMLLSRVLSQITHLRAMVTEHILNFKELIGGSFNLKSFMRFKMSEEQEKRYGLRKNIIIITKHQTMFAIDSKTSKIVWKENIKLDDRQLIGMIKMKRDYQDEVAITITFSRSKQITYIEQINSLGKMQILKEIPTKNLPTIHKLNQYSIMIKDGHKLNKFVLNEEFNHDTYQKQYYFYSIQDKIVTGWMQLAGKIQSIWNFQLSPNETIIASESSFRGQRSRVPLVDQQKVIFKNIDFTNIAVLTRSNNHLNVYAINGRTGHIQFNQYQVGVSFDHPINLVYDENNILITYFHLRNRLYEIWTIEQYQERVQTSALNILKDYFNDFATTPTHSRNRIIFLSEVYGTIVPIKHMFISESKMSLIRRNMIIVSESNQCYTITRELISARRPKNTAIFSNEKYPPYDYILPFSPINFFTYTSQVSQLKHVRFSSSDLQSTIFVFAYGIDAFMIRMAPDRTFDMITEDFNHIVLVAIVIVVTLLVYLLSLKVKSAKLKKNHRE